MASFNKIVIVGNLGRDPELRHTPQGTAVCNFSVATTEKRGDKEHTCWFKVEVWGKQAEACAQYLTKGGKAYIEGRLRVEEYTSRDGEQKQQLVVNASDVQFLGSRGDSGESRAASAAAMEAQRPAQGKAQKPQYAPMDDSDPVPF